LASLSHFLSNGLSLLGTFNPKIAAFLFLLCLIGEAVGLSIPYLLETTWLLAGYQVSAGVLSPIDLILLLVMAQLGRQAGALTLYSVSRSGSAWLAKYAKRFQPKAESSPSLFLKLFGKVNLLSPFSVALGRLLWLRIPLTMVLGTKRRLKTLLLGVSLSSLIYDGTYISLGAVVGTTTKLEPVHILVYFLAGLTALYGITFAIKRLMGSLARRREKRLSVAMPKSSAPQSMK
jgi:membrane-associated protein